MLLQLAHYLSSKSNINKNETQVAIIENEIGSIGIDDKILKRGGYDVQNLFSGCICCNISGELISAISDINERYNPKWLIIESTGMAYPSKIKANIESTFQINVETVILFDAFRFIKLSTTLGTLFFGQLKDASIVLINKIDLVNEALLVEVKTEVIKHNDKANIFCVSAKDKISTSIWEGILS